MRRFNAPSSSNLINNRGDSDENNPQIVYKVQGILNKITPEKFDKLSHDLLNIGLESEDVLTRVLLLIFNKALDDYKYSCMYAKLCKVINDNVSQYYEQNYNKNVFQILLLKKCKEEYENRCYAYEQYDKQNVPLSIDDEEKRSLAKQKMLCNIKFICELGKQQLLPENILHDCITQLLSRQKNQSIADKMQDLECLCEIMKNIGHLLETNEKARLLDQYFDRMETYSKSNGISSRIKFMLLDVIDLRKNNWVPRQKDVLQTSISEKMIPEKLDNNYNSGGAGGGLLSTYNSPLYHHLRQHGHGHGQHGHGHGPHSSFMNPQQQGRIDDMFSPMSIGPIYLGTGPGAINDHNFGQWNNHNNNNNQQRRSNFNNNNNNNQMINHQNNLNQNNNNNQNYYYNLQQQQKNNQQQFHHHQQQFNNNNNNQNMMMMNMMMKRNDNNNNQNNNNNYRYQHQQQFNQNMNINMNNNNNNNSNNNNLPPRFQKQMKHQQQQQQNFVKNSGHYNNNNYQQQMNDNDRMIVPPMMMMMKQQNDRTINNRNQINTSFQQKSNLGFNKFMNKLNGGGGKDLSNGINQLKLNDDQQDNKDKDKKDDSPINIFLEIEKLLNNYYDHDNDGDDNNENQYYESIVKFIKENIQNFDEIFLTIIRIQITKQEKERDKTNVLLNRIKSEQLVNDQIFMMVLKNLFGKINELEVETPRARSYVAAYIANAIMDNVITLKEIGDLLDGGQYYPLFPLILQTLHKSKGQTWLFDLFTESKINLMQMVPEPDRNKERMADILEDRNLTFLYPMLRIESDITKQITSDCSPNSLYRWLKDNVNQTLQNSTEFISVVFSTLLKHIISKHNNVNNPFVFNNSLFQQQEMELKKYRLVLQKFLAGKHDLQLVVLYSLQTYCHDNNFPKGLIEKWFNMLYEQEIVDDEVFFKWREDINEEYPGKGKALFQVNKWLIWLEEDDDEEEE